MATFDDRGVYASGAFGWPACSGHGAAQRAEVDRAIGPARKSVTGRCAVCGAMATRHLSNGKVCATHYRQAATLHNHGITNPIGVLREMLGKPTPSQADPAASPPVEAAPSPPVASAHKPILSLVERLKARRAAGD